METFGWCFIGTGKLAGQVAQQLAGTRHKIVSCYTRNYENAKAFAASVGAEAYEEAADAIAAPEWTLCAWSHLTMPISVLQSWPFSWESRCCAKNPSLSPPGKPKN